MRTGSPSATLADTIRSFVEENYIRPAQSRRDAQVIVTAGDVHRRMKLVNRIPAVCSALRSHELQERNRLRIVRDVAPPSGLSSTVEITYEWTDRAGTTKTTDVDTDPLLALRGTGRELFASLGGGEHFIRRERRSWEKFGDRG